MGSDTSVIFPKLRQAEWFDAKSGTATLAPGRDAAGGGQVVVGKDGAWVQFEPVSFHQIETFNLRVQANVAGGTIELRKGSPTGDVVGTAEVPATGLQYRDVAVDVSELGSETMDLYLVFTGTNDIKLNFFEAIGQGISPEAKPVVAITDPVDGDKLDPGAQVTVAADATDADGSIDKVEFFAGDTKIGEDATAPYTADWTAPDDEGLYELTAKATDDDGNTTTSRLVQVQVGELFGDLVPFSNVNGEFERLGAGQFRISGAGANAWQGTDQYTTLYQPGAGDDEYDAVVRVDASTLANNSGKAGLIIRNDMTQPGTSPGYAMLGVASRGRDGVPHRPRRQRPAQRLGRRRHQHRPEVAEAQPPRRPGVGVLVQQRHHVDADRDGRDPGQHRRHAGRRLLHHGPRVRGPDRRLLAVRCRQRPAGAGAGAGDPGPAAELCRRTAERRLHLAVAAAQVGTAPQPRAADHPVGWRAEPAGHRR